MSSPLTSSQSPQKQLIPRLSIVNVSSSTAMTTSMLNLEKLAGMRELDSAHPLQCGYVLMAVFM